MADETNDTQSKINEEDRKIQQRQHSSEGEMRDDFQRGSSSMPGGGEAEGQFSHQGEAAMGGALGGGPQGTGNTGAQLPGGAQSEFARTTGGQTAGLTADSSSGNPATGAGGALPGGTNRGAEGGSMRGTTGEMTSGSPGGQGVGTVGTIGGSSRDTNEQTGPSTQGAEASARGANNAQDDRQPAGASHQHSADGGSVVAATGSSTGPGAGQTGTDRSEGFIGSQSDDERDQPNQGGFAERGRGAPEGSGPEGSPDRNANLDSDIEGSSRNS